MGLGGNFVQAAPDTEVTAQALRNAAMTVQVSTKLNRSHLECGDVALILPTMGRTEKLVTPAGEQFVTVEDSMSAVHASRGVLPPVSPHVRSEVAIIAGLAEATIGKRHGIDWSAMAIDHNIIREHISRVVPGCEAYTHNVDRPGGFVLPHPPRDSRTFETKSGRAEFVPSPIELLHVPDGHLVLQTLRSHDQFNTTIYGLSDRYRGIEDGRRVVFVHPDDIAALGFARRRPRRPRVALGRRRRASASPSGSASSRTTPRAARRRPTIPRPTRSCRSTRPPRAATSRRPSRVMVRLEPHPSRGRTPTPVRARTRSGADDAHKSDRQPRHLS